MDKIVSSPTDKLYMLRKWLDGNEEALDDIVKVFGALSFFEARDAMAAEMSKFELRRITAQVAQLAACAQDLQEFMKLYSTHQGRRDTVERKQNPSAYMRVIQQFRPQPKP